MPRLRLELYEARQAGIDFQNQTGRRYCQCIRDLIILARLYREYRLTGDPTLLTEIEEYEGETGKSD